MRGRAAMVWSPGGLGACCSHNPDDRCTLHPSRDGRLCKGPQCSTAHACRLTPREAVLRFVIRRLETVHSDALDQESLFGSRAQVTRPCPTAVS